MDLTIRDALYYPYIHIEDPKWLKATLLCFPHVLRMVPSRYHLRDSRLVRSLAKTKGLRDEVLVGRYDLDSHFEAGFSASRVFLEKVGHDVSDPEFLARYSRDAVVRGFGKHGDFRIYRTKISSMLEYQLREKGLAWTWRGRQGPWIGMHPVLGEALMSIIATFVAKPAGLEIVTSDAPVHYAVATHDVNAIYDAVVHDKEPAPQPGRALSSRLAQLVIINHFDLSQLSVADLASMARDREGLFDFRAKVAELAARIPPMSDKGRQARYLKDAQEQIIDGWEKSRASMSKFAKRFFGIGLLDKTADSITKAVEAGGVAAGVGATLLHSALVAAVPGLAVALVVHGARTWSSIKTEAKKSPYRYLTKVQKLGAVTTLVSAQSAAED